VDFGKFLPSSASRRPLHFERVAFDARNIEIAFYCESVHQLSTALTYLAQWLQRTGEAAAQLLQKFPARDIFRVFAGLDLALRDRPRTVILVAPERAAGVHQQHLQRQTRAAVHQDAGAGGGHAITIPYAGA